jgi:hypothetical protein
MVVLTKINAKYPAEPLFKNYKKTRSWNPGPPSSSSKQSESPLVPEFHVSFKQCIQLWTEFFVFQSRLTATQLARAYFTMLAQLDCIMTQWPLKVNVLFLIESKKMCCPNQGISFMYAAYYTAYILTCCNDPGDHSLRSSAEVKNDGATAPLPFISLMA